MTAMDTAELMEVVHKRRENKICAREHKIICVEVEDVHTEKKKFRIVGSKIYQHVLDWDKYDVCSICYDRTFGERR